MNKETFKAGDEVYCPLFGFSIYQLGTGNSGSFPILINEHDGFTSNGLSQISDKTSSIFHATPENKQLLEALYKCEFESPKLKGSDLTRKLLSEGKHVLCYVSDLSDQHCKELKLITSPLEGDFSFVDIDEVAWKYAVPCNDYANLVDGVLTLKSEQ